MPELATEPTDIHGRIVVAPTGEVTNIAQTGKVKRGSAEVVLGISHNNHNIMPGAPITARVTLVATF